MRDVAETTGCRLKDHVTTLATVACILLKLRWVVMFQFLTNTKLCMLINRSFSY